MIGLALRRGVDDLLRGRDRFAAGRRDSPVAVLVAILLCGSVTYGLALGSYGLLLEQAVYSAVKLPLLLLGSALLCLPFFYVVNALLGLGADFRPAAAGVLSGLATTSVCLAALAPVCLFFYASGVSYRAAVLLNGVLFALATWAGQVSVRRHYRPLVERDPRHRISRGAWVTLFVFVSIQMAWTLRPFVGWPGRSPSFLREHSKLRNAYVVLAESIWDLLHGR